MLVVLRSRTFRRLFTAQVVALLGTGLLTVALGLLAFDLAGPSAGAVLGTALTIKMAAYVGVAPVVGALADRIPRRALLVGTEVIRASIAMLLPFVDHVWQIYLLIFVLQSASATFTPAFQALIPAVLPDERDYTRALSLSRLAYDLESLVSPMLAAVALTVMSYHDLFLGTVAGFVASALLVLSARLPTITPPERVGTLATRITAGARTMATRPSLRGLLAMNLVVAAATALVLVNSVVLVRDLLGKSNTDLAIALGFFGGGSMLVALFLPRVLISISDRTLMLTGSATLSAGLAAATVLLLAEPGETVLWAALLALWAVLGAGAAMINTPSARLLREQATADNRTAIFTAQFSLSHACFIVTYPLAGWFGSVAGQFAAAAALTVLATLAALTALWVWPAPRQVQPARELVGSE